MKNLTVNINGDVHITAPTPKKSPPSAMVGVVELECDRDTEINFDFFNIDPDYDEDDEGDEDYFDEPDEEDDLDARRAQTRAAGRV